MAKNVSSLCPACNGKQWDGGEKEAICLEKLQRKLESTNSLWTPKENCWLQDVTALRNM